MRVYSRAYRRTSVYYSCELGTSLPQTRTYMPQFSLMGELG